MNRIKAFLANDYSTIAQLSLFVSFGLLLILYIVKTVFLTPSSASIFLSFFGVPSMGILLDRLGRTPVHQIGYFLLLPIMVLFSPLAIILGILLSSFFLFLRRSIYFLFGIWSIWLLTFQLSDWVVICLVWFCVVFIYFIYKGCFLPILSNRIKAFLFAPLTVLLGALIFVIYSGVALGATGFFDFILFNLSFQTTQHLSKQSPDSGVLILGKYYPKTGQYVIFPVVDDSFSYLKQSKPIAVIPVSQASQSPSPTPRPLLR